MPNLPLTSLGASELLADAKRADLFVFSESLKAEIKAALDTVIVIPPAGGPIPTSLPGYTRVIGQEWTWGTPFPTLTTSGWDGKSIIIVAVNVPPGSTGQRTMTLSELDGRPGVWGTEREVCIAKTPGVFETDIANGYVKAYNPSRAITVDGPMRAVAYLPPGRYFVNAKWSDPSNARMQI